MSEMAQGQDAGAAPSVPLWRSALFGPMPLSYPLIAACVVYYLVGVLLSLVTGGFDWHELGTYFWSPSDSVQVALGNGGRAPLLVWQVWTLVNSSYLHLNLLHIGVNMLCLYQIMPPVEQGFGRLRAFSIYTLSGIAGSLGSAIWGEFYSLGASGALFGLFGAVLVYGMLRRDDYGRYLTLFSLKWAGLNFAFGLFGPIGVSNAGHAGGFVGGVLAALAVIYRTNPQRLPDPRRLAGFLFSLTLLCLAIGAGRATSAAWQAVSDPTGYAAREDDDLLAKTEAMLAFTPGDVEALTQRAQAYAGKGDYDAALKDIDTAIDSGRDTPEMRRYKAWLYSQRGQALAQKGDYSAALADADTAIAGGIDMPGMHRIKAWLLVQLGRTAEALPETEIALRGDPTDVYALNIRAYLNEISGNSDQAIADYRAALRLDPKNESSQQGLQRLSGGK